MALTLALLLDLGAVGQAYPPQALLEGVPRIGYDVHLCPFPGSLYASMEFLGDPVDYDWLMGITGAPFRRFWEKDDGGNVDLMYLRPEPERRAFAALGYEVRAIPPERDAMVAAIQASLAEGYPVIALGVIGPPEAGLATGYEGNGDVLRGWSYFQDNAKPGYYSADNWVDNTRGLLVFGERTGDRPSDRELLPGALAWAIDLERTARRPEQPKHLSGLAACDAWADGLEVDADYPADDPQVMETRAMVHCDQVVMLHERHSAAAFLRRMARSAPEVAGHLTAAAALYDETGDMAGKVWRWGHWQDPKVRQEFAPRAVRVEFAQQVRLARAKEAQAVGYLEAALKLLTQP